MDEGSYKILPFDKQRQREVINRSPENFVPSIRIRAATPSQRSRVIRSEGAIVGFAISGRAGRAGYLQRLAVDPAARRRGLGRTLVDDACAWMTRRGAVRAVVNTATTNDPAITLYTSFGFQRRSETLMVLELELEPG